MPGVIALYRSSVGKKVAMAASGVVLFLWIVGHVYGNLKAFQGPDAINAYAEHLREMGEPLLGHGQVLWAIRLLLLAALVVHVVAATQVTLQSRAARPVAYRQPPHLELSYASRTMRWGGVILLLYVVYHLMHLTWGTAHRDFVPGDVYHNLVAGFQLWPVTLAYLAATLALALHLYHGLWSAFQTLGANHPAYNAWRRPLAAAFAVLLFAGFAAVPVAVQIGVLR
jgi:succinate dehydrogenase / fumarate reductase cytochrome b subunit